MRGKGVDIWKTLFSTDLPFVLATKFRKQIEFQYNQINFRCHSICCYFVIVAGLMPLLAHNSKSKYNLDTMKVSVCVFTSYAHSIIGSGVNLCLISAFEFSLYTHTYSIQIMLRIYTTCHNYRHPKWLIKVNKSGCFTQPLIISHFRWKYSNERKIVRFRNGKLRIHIMIVYPLIWARLQARRVYLPLYSCAWCCVHVGLVFTVLLYDFINIIIHWKKHHNRGKMHVLFHSCMHMNLILILILIPTMMYIRI